MKKIINNKGYTLIELVVVLAVLGIIISISIGSISVNQDVLLKKSANRLAVDLRYIQSKAVYERDSGYKIFANYTQDNTSYQIKHNINVIKTVKLDKGIRYTTSYEDSEVFFNSNGSLYQRAGRFVLVNSKGKEIRITIEVATGRVKIY